MGIISVSYVRGSEAQLRLKRPWVETTDPAAFVVPPSSSAPSTSAPSSSAAGVTLEAIMAQIQQMEADFGGHLDYLTNEMCQINTRVSRIERQHARLGGFATSPCPSPEALADEDDDVGDDVDEDASFSGDD